MAAAYAPQGQPASFKNAVFGYRLFSILAACGLKTAYPSRAQKRAHEQHKRAEREKQQIFSYQRNVFHPFYSTFPFEESTQTPALAHKPRTISKALCRSVKFSLLRGLKIISVPGCIFALLSLNASRKSLLARLRFAAMPSFLDTTTAKRTGPFFMGPGLYHSATPRRCNLMPPCITRLKSFLR